MLNMFGEKTMKLETYSVYLDWYEIWHICHIVVVTKLATWSNSTTFMKHTYNQQWSNVGTKWLCIVNF